MELDLIKKEEDKGWTIDKNGFYDISTLHHPIHPSISHDNSYKITLGYPNVNASLPKSIGVLINMINPKSNIGSENHKIIRVLHGHFHKNENNHIHEFENPQYFQALAGYYTDLKVELIDMDTKNMVHIENDFIAGCLAISY